MAKRLFYREREDGSSIEAVGLDEPDWFRIRVDRPGVAAVSFDLPLADLQELADITWQNHAENGLTPATEPPEKAFGGTDPE